jgi:hypothetical protein
VTGEGKDEGEVQQVIYNKKHLHPNLPPLRGKEYFKD